MNKYFIVFLVLVVLSSMAFAQVVGGDIYGTLVLEGGSKVPGVMITLTGENIGKLTTMSSDKGNFRFLNLPPGNYELVCEMQGFKTIKRQNIQISIGRTVTLNFILETTPLKEEVIVTNQAGIIDTRKTNVGVNVGSDFVDSIPTARNPWTLLSSLPGVMIDRVDVGGADSGQQSNFMAGGDHWSNTSWNVDGATITDISAIGATPAYLNVNSFEELQVSLGANDITAQTGGVQLNFVSKRAGNKISGDFHLYVEDENWEMSQNPTQYMTDNGLVVPGIQRLYQYGINLGGPIVKDKLWWFGSWSIQDIHKRTEASIEDATWLVSSYAKLNLQLGNTTADLQYSDNSKQKWGRASLSPAQQDAGSLWDQTGPAKLYYGSISHIFGNLMLSAKAVYSDSGFTLDPRGSDINAENNHNEGNEYLYIDGGARIEGSIYHYNTRRKSLNTNLNGNFFIEEALGGDHEIRFGVDYYDADTTSQSLQPNQRITYVYRDNPTKNYLGIYPDYNLDVNFKRISAYIQDTINWGKFTAAIGLRYDKEQGSVNSFTQPYFTWYEEGSSHHGERMFADVIPALEINKFKAPASWSLISPRISLTYDITGNGKNVVKLAAGRYMSQSGNNIAGNYIPYRYGFANWTDANNDEIPQFEEVGALTYSFPFTQVDPVTGLNRIQYDPNYNTTYLDELTLMFEKAISDDFAIVISGFLKKKHNLALDLNSRGLLVSVSKGIMADGSIETKDNYEFIGTTTVGGTEVPTYNQIETPEGTYYYNREKAYERYLGAQFEIKKKLSNRWMANLSLTLSDWKRFRFEEEILDMNNFDFFNEGAMAPSSSASGLADIWVNSRWMFKLTGMYQLPWGINLTGFFNAREGNPQPYRRRISSLNQGIIYLYRDGEKSGDQRLPTFWILNLGLEKTLKISERVTATLVMDWYNATNNQIELKYNLEVGENLPEKPQPVMWSNAGVFQFGVRVNF